jgi:hypothetical protein
MKNMRRYLWLAMLSLALVALGCNKMGSRSDSQIASDVQNKIFGDSNVPGKQITINSNKGVVTLTGTVSSEAARSAAANDAAQVDGVKTVVNNLEIASAVASNTPPAQPQQPTPETATAPAPQPQATQPLRATTTHPRRSARGYADNSGDKGLRTTVPSVDSNASTNGGGSSYTQSAPATPPPPSKVTVPAGTQLSIRLSDEVDSEKAHVGDVFHGSISAPVTIDDQTVIPTSADIEGRVVDVKSAGRFAGGSVLTLQLTKLVMNGRAYSIQTDQWSRSGTGKGKGTAAKVGGGAAVGAVLGGIFGGGKGAAIGAAAGAGAGTAGSAVGKGQQILLRPEAVINFTLQNSLTVTPGTSRQGMQ